MSLNKSSLQHNYENKCCDGERFFCKRKAPGSKESTYLLHLVIFAVCLIVHLLAIILLWYVTHDLAYSINIIADFFEKMLMPPLTLYAILEIVVGIKGKHEAQ